MIQKSKGTKGTAEAISLAAEMEQRYGVRRPPEISAEMGRRRWRELNRLLHACMVLHGAGRDRRPLQRVLHTAAGLVGASRGVFYLRIDGETALEPAAAHGFAGGIPEGLRSGGEISPAAMRAGKPLVIAGPEEGRLESELAMLGEPACVSFPIQMEGQPWGVVFLGRESRFEEDEAILLWMYALVVEDALPSLSRGERALRVNPDSTPGGLVSQEAFRSLVDAELQRLPSGARACTLLRIAFRPQDAASRPQDELRSARSLRVLRSVLRPVDRVAPSQAGDLFILLPETNGTEGEQVGQKIRRALIQSRVLGDESEVIRALTVRRASCPEHGHRSAALFQALETIAG